MVSIKDVSEGEGSKRPFVSSSDEENGDEDFENYHQSVKKRRLTVQETDFLEKCFVVDRKLDHGRKLLLAKDLGLQPRQVAVWFQNRRARWKTQQQERQLRALHSCYSNLLANHDRLLREIARLQDEQADLRTKLYLGGSESSFANSHVIDLNNPHYAVANQSAFGELAGSASAVGEDHSGVSQGGAAYLRHQAFLYSNDFYLKPADIAYHGSRANSCNCVLP